MTLTFNLNSSVFYWQAFPVKSPTQNPKRRK